MLGGGGNYIVDLNKNVIVQGVQQYCFHFVFSYLSASKAPIVNVLDTVYSDFKTALILILIPRFDFFLTNLRHCEENNGNEKPTFFEIKIIFRIR